MTVKLAEFLSECPFFEGKVSANYLDGAMASASVEKKERDRRVRDYTDGGRVVTDVFSISIRDTFTGLSSENCRIAEKCREVENWIYKKNKDGKLPALDGADAVSLEVSRGFAPVWNRGAVARYEAELKLEYII